MADWFTLRPKDTFGDLLHLDNSGVGVTSSLKQIEDGHGGDTCLQLSNDTLKVTGNVTVTGTVTAAGYASASLSDATLITATGSVTARTLGARFADRVNVRDWGAVGDGVTDDTTAIQAAITYALTRYYGAEVYIPASNQAYRITATINLPKTSGKLINLCGDGMSSVVWLDNAAVTNAFYIGHASTTAGGSNVRVSDLRVIGASATTIAFRLENASATTFTGVATETCLIGYKIIGSFGCRWSHCTAYSISQNFFYAQDRCHHSVFESISGYAIGGTTNPAFLFQGTESFNIVWRNCDFEGMGYFLRVQAGGIVNGVIETSYIESATQPMVLFDAPFSGRISDNWIAICASTTDINRFTGDYTNNRSYNMAITWAAGCGRVRFENNSHSGTGSLSYPAANYALMDRMTLLTDGMELTNTGNMALHLTSGSGSNTFLYFDETGATGQQYIKHTGSQDALDFYGANSHKMRISTAGVLPGTDNAVPLGTSSFRFSDFRAVTATFSGAVTHSSTASFAGTITAAAATFSGAVTHSGTVTHSAGNKVILDATTPTNRLIEWHTNGVARWKININSDAESGANAGSTFLINRYDDAGSFLSTVMTINRSSGQMALANGLSITGNVGFYGTTPAAKPAVTGSRAGNAALASLLSQLAALGLITDSTTA